MNSVNLYMSFFFCYSPNIFGRQKFTVKKQGKLSETEINMKSIQAEQQHYKHIKFHQKKKFTIKFHIKATKAHKYINVFHEISITFYNFQINLRWNVPKMFFKVPIQLMFCYLKTVCLSASKQYFNTVDILLVWRFKGGFAWIHWIWWIEGCR